MAWPTSSSSRWHRLLVLWTLWWPTWIPPWWDKLWTWWRACLLNNKKTWQRWLSPVKCLVWVMVCLLSNLLQHHLPLSNMKITRPVLPKRKPPLLSSRLVISKVLLISSSLPSALFAYLKTSRTRFPSKLLWLNAEVTFPFANWTSSSTTSALIFASKSLIKNPTILRLTTEWQSLSLLLESPIRIWKR